MDFTRRTLPTLNWHNWLQECKLLSRAKPSLIAFYHKIWSKYKGPVAKFVEISTEIQQNLVPFVESVSGKHFGERGCVLIFCDQYSAPQLTNRRLTPSGHSNPLERQ